MTNREFYNAVIENTTNEELIAHAKKLIENLDKSQKSRNSKENEKRAKENAPLIEKIVQALTGQEDYLLTSEVATMCEMSTSKASALLKKIENIDVKDIKVKGKGTQKGWKLNA